MPCSVSIAGKVGNVKRYLYVHIEGPVTERMTVAACWFGSGARWGGATIKIAQDMQTDLLTRTMMYTRCASRHKGREWGRTVPQGE